MLDLVVDRREMKAVIARALRFMGATAAPPAAVVPVVATTPVAESATQA
jgi:hypothetical protein